MKEKYDDIKDVDLANLKFSYLDCDGDSVSISTDEDL